MLDKEYKCDVGVQADIRTQDDIDQDQENTQRRIHEEVEKNKALKLEKEHSKSE